MYNYSQYPQSPIKPELTEPLPYLAEPQDGFGEQGTAEAPNPIKLGPLARTLVRNAWIIAGVTAITTAIGIVNTYFKPSTYTGNFYLLVEPITAAARLTDPSTIARTGGTPNDSLTALDYPTNLAFLQSPGMTFKIAQDVKSKASEDKQVAAIWKNIRDNLKVSWVRSATGRDATKLFEVSYSGADPKEVEKVLRVAAETFVTYSAEDRETSIKAGVKFIDNQLPGIQQNLDVLKNKQRQLRERYRLVDPTLQNQSLLEQLTALENQKVVLEQQLLSQQALVKSLEEDLKLTKDQAVTAEIFTADEQRNQLLSELNRIEVEIASNSAIYTDDSSQMQSLKEQKANVEALLAKRTGTILSQVKTPLSPDLPDLEYRDPTRLGLAQQLVDASNQVNALTTQIAPLNQKIESIQQEIQALPKVIDEFTALAREIALTEGVVDRLSTQRETLKVESSQELPWQLISDPQIPLNAQGDYLGEPPSRTRSMAIGFAGGFIISTLAVLLWDRYRNMFYSSADVKDILGLSLLGEVPRQDTAFQGLSQMSQPTTVAEPEVEPSFVFPGTELATVSAVEAGQEQHSNGQSSGDSLSNGGGTSVAIAPNPDNELELELGASEFLEFTSLFDELYTELSFYYRNPALRSMVFSSVERGDGQSTLLLNMAIAASEQGRKVLLVDGNEEHPCLHRWLKLNNKVGLSDYLAQDIPLEKVIQTAPDRPNIDLISYGSQTELKHLWLPKMRRLMPELHAQYDLVLYDLSHFMDGTDVYNISAETDGIIFVVAKKQTPKSRAVQAAKKSKDLRLPVLGVITNFM